MLFIWLKKIKSLQASWFFLRHTGRVSVFQTQSVWKSNILKYEVVEAFQILQHFSNPGHNKTSIFFLFDLFFFKLPNESIVYVILNISINIKNIYPVKYIPLEIKEVSKIT